MTFLIVTFFTLFSLTAKCQKTYTLPKGYQTKDVNGEVGARIEEDFDNDGITDLAIICFKDDGSDPIAVVFLSTKYLVNGIYSWFPWQHMINDFDYKNQTLILSGTDMGRYGTTLKLKYYANLKNMKLIGYENNYLGDSENYGAYDVSINLNTGEYQVNGGEMKKINIDLITLSNIEKYFDYLSQVGGNN